MKGRAHRQCAGALQNPLAEETQILKAILLGEALPVTLNKLCTLVDVRIGNVVSMVCLADAEDGFAESIAQTAAQFTLHVFSSINIVSPNHQLLGTLQVYSLDRRRPTSSELQLIERVTHLAAIALQRHRDTLEIDFFSQSCDNSEGSSAPETPPFIN